jgi:response regulator of citrate/malate metabolism
MKKTISVIEDDVLLANLMKDKINESSNYQCIDIFNSAEKFMNKATGTDIILLDVMLKMPFQNMLKMLVQVV